MTLTASNVKNTDPSLAVLHEYFGMAPHFRLQYRRAARGKSNNLRNKQTKQGNSENTNNNDNNYNHIDAIIDVFKQLKQCILDGSYKNKGGTSSQQCGDDENDYVDDEENETDGEGEDEESTVNLDWES